MFLPRIDMLLLMVGVLPINIVEGFQTFADRIPNGKRVPNPGPQGGVWAGVGHLRAGGSGELNPFGQAFAAAGYEWTVELCQMDSDGDGRSNGQELGDPECVWSTGDNEPALPSLSHPGIIDEPQDGPPVTACSEYVEPQTAIEYEIKFSKPTTVDGNRTHYICEQFDQPVPSKEILHQVKNRVLLDNNEILHHIFVFVCPEGSGDGNKVGQGPYECGGNESRCTRFAGWAVGADDYCFPPNVGQEFDFSDTGNMVVKVEAHYDNALGIPQQDQSGMVMTFTPELRPLKSHALVLGMSTRDNKFQLPPLQSSHSLTTICPSEATAQLSHPLFVYQFSPHMHLFGRSLFTEHYRCGKKIGEIGRINAFEFDNQQQYVLDSPVKILPGDALVTTCQYNTLDSTTMIVGGEETTDEMCLNFLSSYPQTEDGVLNACFSFSEGTSGVPDTVPSSLASALGNLGNLDKFVFSGRGREGILFEYEIDPTKSWSPCCDDDSCDAFLLADTGGACVEDRDCVDDLVCDDGLCADAPDVDSTASGSALFPSASFNFSLTFLMLTLIALSSC